jgi:hypothetical protein
LSRKTTEVRTKVKTFTAELAKCAEKHLKKLCDLCVLGGKSLDNLVCPNSCPKVSQYSDVHGVVKVAGTGLAPQPDGR